MNKYNSKFSFRYELKDNEDTSQNLFVKTYQGPSMISETDLGNMFDIVVKVKENTNLKQALIDIRQIIIRDTTDDNGKDLGYSDCIQYDDILQIIDKHLGGNN